MAERALAGKRYQGIRSFGDCVGKTVIRVEWLKAKDEKQSHPFSFSEAIVFWCEDLPLVVSNYIEFIVNPYYMESGLECVDINEEFRTIIGKKIGGLQYQTANYARISFENGNTVLFGNDIGMGGKHKPIGKYLIEKRNIECI